MQFEDVPAAVARSLILIVASHDVVREALRAWLSVKFSDCCCAATSTNEKALAIACAEGPDVAIVELDVPDSGGAETLRTIRRACPQSHLVVVSEHAEEVNRICAETENAGSFVCNRKINAELLSLIRTLLQRSRHA